MKPTDSPTQGQPNPTKIRLKVAFGPLFFFSPHRQYFFVRLGWDGIDVYNRKRTARNPTQPNLSANTLCPDRWHWYTASARGGPCNAQK